MANPVRDTTKTKNLHISREGNEVDCSLLLSSYVGDNTEHWLAKHDSKRCGRGVWSELESNQIFSPRAPPRAPRAVVIYQEHRQIDYHILSSSRGAAIELVHELWHASSLWTGPGLVVDSKVNIIMMIMTLIMKKHQYDNVSDPTWQGHHPAFEVGEEGKKSKICLNLQRKFALPVARELGPEPEPSRLAKEKCRREPAGCFTKFSLPKL